MKHGMRRPWMLVAIAAACGPPLGAGEPSEPDQARARASIQRMLDHGFKPGPAGLKAAEESYNNVANLASADPRIDYAWGLVLLRQFRHAQATERFQAATQSPGDPFWPAWRALIWCRLTARHFDRGLQAVEALADHLLDAPVEPEDKREIALWLGRTIAALEITTEPADRKDRIVALDLQIRQRLGRDLLEAYESGKPQTWKQHTELLHQIDELREETIEKNTQAKEEAQQQIQAGLQKLTKQKEAVANTADNWKQWLDEQARKSDRQLIALRKDTAYLQRRAASVQQSLWALGIEYTARELAQPAPGIYGPPGRRIRVLENPRTDFLRLQQEQQWLGYQVEFLGTLQQMQRVHQSVVSALSQRRTDARRYASATGQLTRRQQTINSRAARLLREVTDLDEQPLDSSPQLVARKMRIRKLSTYVDLDFDAERIRLLESLDAP